MILLIKCVFEIGFGVPLIFFFNMNYTIAFLWTVQVKTGMLHSGSVIEVLCSSLKEFPVRG